MYSSSADHYDDLYGWKDYRDEAAKLERMIHARRPEARSLLDVACGTGSHLEHLRAWFEIQGAELEPKLVRRARERLPGVEVHATDMLALELDARFDVVTCLFGSIGYAGSFAAVKRVIARMAAQLERGGLLVLEPWLSPETYRLGVPHLLTVDRPELKLVRTNVSRREGDLSILDFHYLKATSAGVESFRERHALALLTDGQYREAFALAGLKVEQDPVGLDGRGLYLGLLP